MPCQLLDWDTNFFGFRVARITRNRLAEEEFSAVLDWCRDERIRSLYLLADPNDNATTCGAENHGFHLVDIRTTLERPLEHVPESTSSIRLAAADDVVKLAAIARVSHMDSRFFYDGNFSRRRCEDLYAVWIGKSVCDSAQAVFVAERATEPAGYITCNLEGDTGQIGLIAVADWARGEGLGKSLICASLHYFKESGMKRVTVVTQGRNVIAQRMYESSGFLLRSVELWYHRWFPDCKTAADGEPG